jgi:uncharacterized membrane protein
MSTTNAPGAAAPPQGPAMAIPVTPVAQVELRIARILVIGTRVAIAVLAVGVVLLLASGRSPLDPTWPPLHLASIPAGLLALQPEAYLWTGLLIVLATPLLRVVASTLGFLETGERLMAALGAAVLVVLATAVITSLATGG